MCFSAQTSSQLCLTGPGAEPGVVGMVVDCDGLRFSQSLGALWEADPHLSAGPVTRLRLIPQACGSWEVLLALRGGASCRKARLHAGPRDPGGKIPNL